MKARRAMLCVREIMRTETSYRGHLVKVWETESANPSPSMPAAFFAHLPALIAASASLSRHLEEDPSAYGVSTAFLSAADELEKALVAWCGVVGQVMIELANNSASLQVGSRASMYYRKYSTGPKDKDADKDKSPKRSDTAGSGSSSGNAKPSKGKKDKSRPNSSGSTPTTPSFSGSKALGIQDVAIMPSQRVPRYVLLFKDLLQQTPITSPSRALVERALEGAMRIAKSCDDAQQHSALFITS